MFKDRVDAGRQLAMHLKEILPAEELENAVVIGLPRGGVPVAYEVATFLRLPLDVIVVRKVGVPQEKELAMGAIAEGNMRFVNENIVRACGVTREEYAQAERREAGVLAERAKKFRMGRDPISLAGKTVIVIDDGIATGSTARMACKCARVVLGAARVILAAPVAPRDMLKELAQVCDKVVVISTPSPFRAIGCFYRMFDQTDDQQVMDLLHRASNAQDGKEAVAVAVTGGVNLNGELKVPQGAKGVVLFVHGSGSSRHSPRNQFVATACNKSGLGTLLFDLLTVEEEANRKNVFDIELLATRLRDVHHWLRAKHALPVVYFGASTGAGAALFAAASEEVKAVVSRGGRPDLAGDHLPKVRAPTLLIVGGEDHEVIRLNQNAQKQLTCESRLEIVPGATHLFEEPGTLDKVAEVAIDWFLAYLN